MQAGEGSFRTISMVGVAQLVEPRIVIPVVEGSSPFVRPIFFGPIAPQLAAGDVNPHRNLFRSFHIVFRKLWHKFTVFDIARMSKHTVDSA